MNQKTVEKTSGFAPLQDEITHLIAALRGFVAAQSAAARG
jgi:hypothetical protein